MDAAKLTYLVQAQEKDGFLRDILSDQMRLSHSLVVKLKQQHKIRVNNTLTRTSYRVQPGDLIAIDLNLEENNEIIPEAIPLNIIYEDPDYLAVNKPPAMAVHPGNRSLRGTLANAVTYYWQQSGRNILFRPINRLDKDTSGLVLIAKSQFAHQSIFQQQKNRRIRRRYFALVEGLIKEDHGRIDQPIARLDGCGRMRVADPTGQSAITNYQVLKRYRDYTYLLLQLETGRTHQIRVHLSYLGHPVCGDTLYGKSFSLLDRQALHAGILSFIHPRTGKELTLTAPLPGDLQRALDILNQTMG